MRALRHVLDLRGGQPRLGVLEQAHSPLHVQHEWCQHCHHRCRTNGASGHGNPLNTMSGDDGESQAQSNVYPVIGPPVERNRSPRPENGDPRRGRPSDVLPPQ
jgi:hypothetical protein